MFLTQDNVSYDQLKAELKAEQPPLSAATVSLVHNNGVDYESSKKYPLDVLQEKDTEKLPIDVNPAQKEVIYLIKLVCTVLNILFIQKHFSSVPQVHLDEAGFQEVFKMDYKTFSGLPQWKRQQLKKAAGLF